MQRIVYVASGDFLGIPLKGRIGTIKSTVVDKKNRKTYHNIEFEGIAGNILQLSIKSLNTKTIPVLS